MPKEYNYSPSWSYDGEKIAFVCYTLESGDILGQLIGRSPNHPNGDIPFETTRSEICVMNADGSHLKQLSNNFFSDYDPEWAPNTYQLAIISNRETGHHLYVIDLEKQQTQKISQLADVAHPAWSPNSNQIVYSTKNGLFISNVITRNDEQFSMPISDYPTWSQDGKMIAFITKQANECYLNINSIKDSRNIIKPIKSQCNRSTWSPNNQLIAFVNEDENTQQFQLSILNILTGTINVIVKTEKWIDNPVWSPSNNNIFFLLDGQIYSVDVFTGEKKQITDSKMGFVSNFVGDQSMVLSPNGKYIAFAIQNDGTSHIWKVSSNGSDLIKLY